MPYIIVRSTIDPSVNNLKDTAFKEWVTFIECHAEKEDECRIMERIMRRLGAERSLDGDKAPFYICKVDKPPYLVLNILELESYNVVGTNTVSNHLIWTLQGVPLPQAQ